jgi:vancomycin resistance protein YoaR
MIVALLLMLLFGSSESALQAVFDRAEKGVETVVVEKAGRKKALAIIDEAKATDSEFKKKREKVYKDWIKLSRRTDTSAAEYEAMFESLQNAGKAHEDAMIRHRMELRDQLSKEDWEKIFPPKL